MNDRPVVSVITIFLNAEAFIAEAIDSVFAQTCDNWELLLVDDGSTDRSPAIARQCARDHPLKVRYLAHEGGTNRGMSASRNLGLSEARAPYIALLDADDVWLPHKLERQVGLLSAMPRVSLVYGRSQYWRSWTGRSEDAGADVLSDIGAPPNSIVEPPELVRLWFAGRKTSACPSNVMFRRDMAVRLGGFDDAFRGMFEDLAFLFKVFLAEPVFAADECWDRHRHHPDSCVWVTSSDPRKWRSSWLFFLSWFEEYLVKTDVPHAEIRAAVQRALWPSRHPRLYWLSRLPTRLARQALPRVSRRPGTERSVG